MARSIYPSIPMPGAALATIAPAVEALRQTVNLIILNGLSPNQNYTPSETAQVFVTYAALTKTGIVGPRGPAGPQGPAGTPGIAEAPNDVNIYGRHALAWQSLSLPEAMTSLATPPASTSTAYQMLGLGLDISTTIGTAARLAVSGNISNTANNGETDAILCYGTGTPPVNGVAQTGTIIGSIIRYMASSGGSIGPFSKSVVITSLALGTAYWFDLAMKAVTGSAQIHDIDITVNELL
jgi:hypothetical protein